MHCRTWFATSLIIGLLASSVEAKCAHAPISVEVLVTDTFSAPIAGSVTKLAWDYERTEPEFTHSVADSHGKSSLSIVPSGYERSSIFRGDICGEPKGHPVVCADAPGYRETCRSLPRDLKQSVTIVLEAGRDDEA